MAKFNENVIRVPYQRCNNDDADVDYNYRVNDVFIYHT